MKKILLCCLSLSLCLFLAACDTIVTSERGDKQPQQDATPPPSAATQIQQLTAGDAGALHPDDRCEVEITPDLRAAFFDLAQQDRLDFMPAKDHKAGQEVTEEPISIEDLGDYLYWVLAQAIVWESYGNIDHEQTPEKLSAADVHDFLQTHCGIDTPTPEAGSIAEIDFDGEYYYYPSTSWAEAPVWKLGNLTLENVNGQIIYCASVSEYNNTGDSIEYPPDNAWEIIANAQEMPEPFKITAEYEIFFTFNEDNEIIYLGKTIISE